jgi:hypothetical protein
MASIADLYVDQGTSFETDVEIAGNDGYPLDLTGYQIVAQIRRHPTSKIKIDFDAEITEAGKIKITLTPTETSQLFHARYMYDVKIISGEGNATRVVEGQLFVNPQITA